MTMQQLVHSRPQRGFALFMGLVFLLMITLVAATAMRGTSLELNMANNTANKEEAFEGAESARMATVRILRDNVSCQFRWSLGAQETGTGGTCRTGCDLNNEFGPNRPKYPWEVRLTVDDPAQSLEFHVPGEVPSDPRTFADRFTLRYGPSQAGISKVGVYMMEAVLDEGDGSLNSTGYEGISGSGASGGAARIFDVVSHSEISQARASVGGHYRLLMSEAKSNCDSDLPFSSDSAGG